MKPYEVRTYEPIGPLTLAPGWQAKWRNDDGTTFTDPIIGFALTRVWVRTYEKQDERPVLLSERTEPNQFVGYTSDDEFGIATPEQDNNFVCYVGPEDTAPEDTAE